MEVAANGAHVNGNSQDKLLLIVPYRQRQQHLDVFLPYQHAYLLDVLQGQPFEIVVAEQYGAGPFNKAKLMNAAVKHQLKTTSGYTHIGFQDVDTIPIARNANYYVKPPSGVIRHPYGHLHCLSNFFVIQISDFERINGFPICYAGYGYEDVEIQHRAISVGLHIDREGFQHRPMIDATSRIPVSEYGRSYLLISLRQCILQSN